MAHGTTHSSVKLVPISVRVPPRLHERLVEHAAANMRSLNSEIVWRLLALDRKERNGTKNG